ncbi:MAG: succinate dehydrogenase cytochrome b subunit [Bacteroidales bacterium]|nr:succinate dehydrogenase cytochrome b subunit [Bacteroidales bacterium]
MANIFTSSIGKKLIMSISGLFLVLFLTLHAVLNFVSVFSAEGFEKVCEFMALPVVGIMVPVLAAGFVVHIIYAFVLTIGNLKARGGLKRYEVANKANTDSWAAKNMIYLGIIVVVGLALHLTDFWANMQLKDWMGETSANPNKLIDTTFSSVGVTALYIVWFVALWLHLTHGFWSAFQTIGWNNMIWLKRWKAIGIVIVTCIMLLFTITAVVGCARSNGWMAPAATESVCDGSCGDDSKGCCEGMGDCEGNHEGCDDHKGHNHIN